MQVRLVLIVSPLLTIILSGCPDSVTTKSVIDDLQKMEISCPNFDNVCFNLYKDLGLPPGKTSYAQIPGSDRCVDKDGNWCGCGGVDCLLSKAVNDRFSVQLMTDSPILSSKTWKITFKDPSSVKINRDPKVSSCYHKEPVGSFPSGTSTWGIVGEEEFTMPKPGIYPSKPDAQICIIEVEMNNKIYHEHFVTNEPNADLTKGCYGWVECTVVQ